MVAAALLSTSCSVLDKQAPSNSSNASTPVTETPSPTPTTLAEALKVVKPAVARISTTAWMENPEEPGQFECGLITGTGFAVSPHLLVTSAHVAEDHDRLRVTYAGVTTPGTVVGYDRRKDVALIKISRTMPGQITFRDEAGSEGEPVATYGFAEGKGAAFLSGTVNRVNQKIDVAGGYQMSRMLELDFATKPGNSGGPVFDKSAKVVGIVAAGSDVPGDKFAVSSATAAALVERWISEGTRDEPTTRCEVPITGQWMTAQDVTNYPRYSVNVHSAVMTLQTYWGAINDADYVTAHAQLARPGSLEAFTEGVVTSRVSDVSLDDIQDPKGGPPVIDVSFTSTQDAGQGPAGREDEECTDWTLRYTFVSRDDMWLIDRTKGIDGHEKSQPCAEGEGGD